MRFFRKEWKLEAFVKRLGDLKGRKSHAVHETEVVLADLLNELIKIGFNHPIRRMRYHFALIRAVRQHRDCCGNLLDY